MPPPRGSRESWAVTAIAILLAVIGIGIIVIVFLSSGLTGSGS